MADTILLTGATGFLGTELAACLLQCSDAEKIYALVRADDDQEADHKKMAQAAALTRRILVRMGIPEEKQFLGTLNAGHPGGMLPLSAAEKDSLHPAVLPDNLYVADATLLPGSMGNPPILTIMALAKKIASVLS